MSAKDRAELLKLREKNKQSPKLNEKKEEIKPKTFKEKRDNFFYHYKIHVIAGAIAMVFTVFFIFDMVTQIDYDLNISVVTNDYMVDTTVAAIESYFKAITSDVNGDGVVNIMVSPVYINPADEQNAQGNMTAQMKVMAELSAGDIYLYLLDEATYNRMFKDQGVFININNDDKISLAGTDFGDLLYENVNYYLAARENTSFEDEKLSKSKQKEKLIYEESIRLLREIGKTN